MPDDKAANPERVDTDSSLQAERDKTDDALIKQGTAADLHADDILELARARADVLLEVERQRADLTLKASDPPAAEIALVASLRASEDDAVATERAIADDQLEAERAQQLHALTLLLGLERDETNEHLLMERERADRVVASRDDFLAMVSHDVRGILGGMTMSADALLRSDGADRELVQREGERLQRLTARMNRLIGDLLDVVSMESGKLDMTAQVQDASGLVIEAVETFQLTASAREIALTSAIDGPAVAFFDHHRLLQVLTNLVGNALKFTPAGGTITVQLATTGDDICFTVRDTGSGIPAGQLESIFERFSQASQSDRRGLGLGLYIARSIVAAHGGRIWAESEPSRGSAFHFTLPSAIPA